MPSDPLPAVFYTVTCDAECASIVDDIPEFRMLCPRLDVIDFKVYTIRTALLTGVIVAGEYCVAPCLVLVAALCNLASSLVAFVLGVRCSLLKVRCRAPFTGFGSALDTFHDTPSCVWIFPSGGNASAQFGCSVRRCKGALFAAIDTLPIFSSGRVYLKHLAACGACSFHPASMGSFPFRIANCFKSLFGNQCGDFMCTRLSRGAQLLRSKWRCICAGTATVVAPSMLQAIRFDLELLPTSGAHSVCFHDTIIPQLSRRIK